VSTDEHRQTLLRPPEAARVLGVSLSTVRRLIHANQLPAVRVGGQLRVDPVDLARLVTERRTA